MSNGACDDIYLYTLLASLCVMCAYLYIYHIIVSLAGAYVAISVFTADYYVRLPTEWLAWPTDQPACHRLDRYSLKARFTPTAAKYGK